ncbi:MAG: hypothetical protein WCC69_08055 [Pirellulales bacterium]
MNLLSGNVWVGFDELVSRPSIPESLENQFDPDSGASDLGLAGNNVRSAVDVITPVHSLFPFLSNKF